MFIDNYLESFIKVQDHKNNIKLSIEEARALVFAKASMFFFAGDEMTEAFADEAMEILLPNPLQADSEGVFPKYFAGDNVRMLVQDSRAEQVVEYYVGDIKQSAVWGEAQDISDEAVVLCNTPLQDDQRLVDFAEEE